MYRLLMPEKRFLLEGRNTLVWAAWPAAATATFEPRSSPALQSRALVTRFLEFLIDVFTKRRLSLLVAIM
jgi:hypothetical protein